MKQQSPSNHSESGQTSAMRRLAARWRWYHFYFLLAMFDVLVLIATMVMYHRTLSSYAVSLRDLGQLDEAHRWVEGLRYAIIRLNAPGNDVFETRDVPHERLRFDRTWTNVQAVMDRADEFDVDLQDFRLHLQRMVVEEKAIFDVFDQLQDEETGAGDVPEIIVRVTARMASMDRHQAMGLEVLATIAGAIEAEEHRLLSEHGRRLQRSVSIEKYFMGVVFLMLVGVFWFGRKLQQANDTILLQRQHAVEEKLARLAAVGEVCSAVSHGIKNPLAAINSSAQLAIEFGTLDEMTKRRIEDILHESRRLNERVNRLLDFSNAKPSQFEACDLSTVIRSASQEVQAKLDEQSVCVTLDLPDEPIRVHGDREWLVQSIIELISNAMEHLSGGGNVHVRCTSDTQNRYACIDVMDDGPGISESIRDRIFDLFFTSKAEGNGVGLASVKRAVEMHGGRVVLMDSSGQGTHISIQLPLAPMDR